MKQKTIRFLFAATMLVAQLATAQMMSGGHQHAVSPGNGMQGSGAAGAMGPFMGETFAVGSDGIIYTLRTSQGTGNASPWLQVIAVRPSGVVAWSTTVDGGMSLVRLSGDLLLVSNGGNMGMNGSGMGNGSTSNNDKGSLVALSTASGLQQWKLDIDGFVGALEPFSGGTYVSVVKTSGTNGSGAMSRSLLAVGPDGKVLWTLQLTQ